MSKRTYGELIRESVIPIQTEEITLPDGSVQKSHEVLAQPFPCFIRSMIGLFILQADHLCKIDYGKITTQFGDEKEVYDGKPIENPTADDLVVHCILPNMGRNMAFRQMIYGFLSWLLKEEWDWDEHEGLERWCDIGILQEKLNEFAEIQRARGE